MKLAAIKTVLEADGFITALEPATEDMPLEHLVVVLDRETDPQRLALQLVYLPDDEGQVENAALLQFYVGLPVQLAEAALDEVRRLLSRLNQALPLVGLHLHEDEQFVYFRHVAPMPRGDTEAMGPVILETVWLIHYVVETVSPAVAAVAGGALTAAEVLAAPRN